MGEINKLMGFVALIFVLLFSPLAMANTYQGEYYIGTDNPDYYTPSFGVDADCSINITSRSSVGSNSYPYDLTTIIYSPGNTSLAVGYLNDLGVNQTCNLLGQASTTTEHSNGTYEARVSITGGDDYAQGIFANLNCDLGDTEWITLSQQINDSRNEPANIYGWTTVSDVALGCAGNPQFSSYFVQDAINNFTEYYGGCADLESNGFIPGYNWNPDSAGYTHKWLYQFMPFNSSSTGIVNISVNMSAFTGREAFCGAEIGYFELGDNTSYVNISYSDLSDYQLTLKRNTDYVLLLMGWADDPGSANLGIRWNQELNLSIFVYEPDWSCTDWSDCNEGYQSRTCTDLGGRVPDEVSYQACYDVPWFTLNLGFEDYYTYTGVKKCVKSTWPFCWDAVVEKENDYPVSWSVINPSYRDFMTMTSETATEGSRSLKMWYIPPSMQPEAGAGNYTLCNHTEAGSYPQIFRGINDTNFIVYNVTFPSPFMTIDWDAKRCTEPVEKYSGWCGDECYGFLGNCSANASTVKGNYLFRLYDPGNDSIVDFYGGANEEWTSYRMDLSDKGIKVNYTYNIVIAVNPYDIYSGYTHCVHFDSIAISFRTAVLPCEESFCDGYDLYIPKAINDSCVYEVRYNDGTCLPESIRDEYEDREDFCIGRTLFTWDNQTLEWLVINESQYCIDIEDTTDDQLTYDTFTSMMYGFFTPLVIALIIAIVGAILTIKETKLQGSGAGLVFLIVFLSILGIESILGYFPGWFTLVLIAISGIGIAWFFVGRRD